MNAELLELLTNVIKHLVDKPDQVSVTVENKKGEKGEDETVALILTSEAGKVIGRQGKTVNALRTVFGAMCAKEKKKLVITVKDR